MQATIRTLLASLPFALAALTASGPANARQPIDFHVQIVQQAPARVVQHAPVYVADDHEREWRGDRREWRHERRQYECRAERWNPNVRYGPGDVVRRRGEFYIARRVSAHVWNVNSPPEWTPNYWAPARC